MTDRPPRCLSRPAAATRGNDHAWQLAPLARPPADTWPNGRSPAPATADHHRRRAVRPAGEEVRRLPHILPSGPVHDSQNDWEANPTTAPVPVARSGSDSQPNLTFARSLAT